MEKKVYVVKIGRGYLGSGIYSESKEKILKLWEAFNEGNFRKLKSENEWSSGEKFHWSEPLEVQLESKTIYLHEDEERALKAKKAYKHAKKVGIISKKKIKKP